MVAAACVIAQLDMLKRGAELCNWTIEDRKIDDLLEEARELNHASANQLSSTDSAEWFNRVPLMSGDPMGDNQTGELMDEPWS
jgi:hypothetical protein